MFDPVEYEIVTAVVALAAPLPFLLAVGAAVLQLVRDRPIGDRLAGLVTFAGGLTLGGFLLAATNDIIAAPVVLIPLWLAWGRWRAGRRRQAGLLIAGLALPSTAFQAWRLTGLAGEDAGLGTLLTAAAPLAVAGVAFVASILIAVRPDPPVPTPRMTADAGQPGSRSIGSIAAAIRAPSMLGPFGLPEILMLLAFGAAWLVVPFLLPRNLPFVLQVAIPSLLAGVVATEAYVRGMPRRSRRAFEAFSWLGEWELARAKRSTGGNVPTNEIDAEHWLVERPERLAPSLDEAFLRVEVLLLVGRIDEARALLRRIDDRATTPWERFEVAALADLVSWRAGDDGDLSGMESAAATLLPPDSDERLRAEVLVAVAKVRRLMADGRPAPGDASAPLLEVRELLGRRADGQVGRALRRRLLPVLLVSSVVFGVLTFGLNALAEGGSLF